MKTPSLTNRTNAIKQPERLYNPEGRTAAVRKIFGRWDEDRTFLEDRLVSGGASHRWTDPPNDEPSLTLPAMERTKVIVSLLAALALTGAACDKSPDDEEGSSEPPKPTQAVVRDGDSLVLLDLTDGSEITSRIVGESQVAVSPDLQTFIVTSGAKKGEDPTLLAGPLEGNASDEIGLGRDPIFSPDGALVAAVVKREDYKICPFGEDEVKEADPDDCVTANSVAIYDAEDPDAEPQLALGGGRWRIVGWSDGEVLAASNSEQHVRLGAPASAYQDQTRLQLDARAVIAVSPVALDILVGDPNGVAIQTMAEDGSIAETSLLPVDTSDIEMAAWSPDGKSLAISLRSGKERSVTIYSRTGAELGTERPGRFGAWDNSGDYFAIMSEDGASSTIEICTVALRCGDRVNLSGSKLEILALR